jgi:hypothetical protein
MNCGGSVFHTRQGLGKQVQRVSYLFEHEVGDMDPLRSISQALAGQPGFCHCEFVQDLTERDPKIMAQGQR